MSDSSLEMNRRRSLAATNDTRKIDNLASESYILEGAGLLDPRNSSLLYDRIINIKFIRAKPDASGKDYFIVRSDYEPEFHDDGGYGTVLLKKCAQKPSISITYDQVSNSTAVNVKIRIESFFIDREAAGNAIDDSAGNPVLWAEVQLGYFDEFPRWDELAANGENLDDFFNMQNKSLKWQDGSTIGKQLRVQILNAFPESLPPEQTWVFNGVVATVESGFAWKHDASSLVPGYGCPTFPMSSSPNHPNGMSKLEMMLYQFITRRFIRAGVDHKVIQIPATDNQGNAILIPMISVKDPLSDDYIDLQPDSDGLMTPEDADLYGVICHCSEELRAIGSHDPTKFGGWTINADGTTTIKYLADAVSSFQMFDEVYTRLGSQINAIRNHFQFLRFYNTTDGNLFFYSADEKSADILADPYVIGKMNTVVKLGAIYDITMSGMRTIRCPFRQLIDPMTIVRFQSRFNIIDTTGVYYQPKQGYDYFMVILSSLAFSTVKDDNMMTLSCTDLAPDQIPAIDPETGIVTPPEGKKASLQTYTDDPRGKVQKAISAYADITIKIGVFPYPNIGWVALARTLLASANKEDWPLFSPTIEMALTDLSIWNASGVWNSGRLLDESGHASPDNALMGNPNPPTIPWLYAGDSVIIRQPYKAGY